MMTKQMVKEIALQAAIIVMVILLTSVVISTVRTVGGV